MCRILILLMETIVNKEHDKLLETIQKYNSTDIIFIDLCYSDL